jgi:GT2 family glycosyltransferase
VIHVSVVIVHYNDDRLTNQCLESLAQVSCRHFGINTLVVDNGSKVPFKISKRVNPSKFQVIRSESNLGFTGGNNLGIHLAIEKYNSQYVLLLNNDTTVSKSFIERLLTQIQSDPSIGMVCPKIYFYPGDEYHANSYSKSQKGKVIWYAGATIDWDHLSLSHRGVDELDYGQFDNQSETDFATGCCVLIKRELLEKIGTFDKSFFLYLEDADLSLRAIQAGYKISFCPKAFIWHKNASSSGTGSSIQNYYQTRNKFLFAIKHAGHKSWLNILRLFVRALRSNNHSQRLAAFDVLSNQFGKRSVI